MKMTKRKIICVITALLFVVSAVYPNYRAYSEEASKATLTDAIEEATEISEEVTETTTEKDTEAAVVQSDESSSDETELSHQSLEVFPDKKDKEKSVTLEGLMPVDATAKVVDVTDDAEPITSDATPTDAKSDDEAEECTVLAAYDISIMDGNSEYQPEEERPISVQINDPQITSDSILHVWHIRDDGTKEEILDITVEDGSVSFDATGFSVYEIVEDVFTQTDIELFDYIATYGEFGLNVSYVASQKKNVTGTPDKGGPYYIGDEIITISNQSAPDNTKRKGLESSAQNDSSEANKLYFEKAGDNANDFYIYLYDGAGNKQYIEMLKGPYGTGSNKDRRGSIQFASGDSKSLFSLEKHPSCDRFRIYYHADNGHDYLWIRNDNNPNAIMPIVGYSSTNTASEDQGDNGTVWMEIEIANPVTDLDGVTYGLMSHDVGIIGNALMANATTNSVLMAETQIRQEGGGTRSVYATEDTEITEWTFTKVSANQYYLSANVGGTTKYLKISDSGVSLTDTASDDNLISVYSGTDDNEKKIKLTSGQNTLLFDGSGFTVSQSANDNDKIWFDFVEKTTVNENDIITYSAKKISVSEAVDQQSVIVYTRVWNEAESKYDFYAVDHDGSLVQCYERGSDIMWLGKQINTLLWTYTVYTDSDGAENNYYELQNEYSGKYLAPQIDGQVLSDNTIGINMPGRKYGDYYSEIYAWDDPYYAYAGLKADTSSGQVISCPRKNAESFYFAVMDLTESDLTEVDTIDNNQYGITMKMKDIDNRSTMDNFLADVGTGGEGTTLHQELLSPRLSANGYPDVTGNDNNLGTLLSGATTVNHLFLENIYNTSGYFEFDSSQNTATLKPNGVNSTDFTVYKELSTNDSSSKASLQHGQFLPYNYPVPGEYSTKNPQNLYSAKRELLDDDDPRKYEKLYLLKDAPDYQFVMEMDASFISTPDGKDAWGHDIIFEFTGDDDFWLYVDGDLVIDLGGVHSAVPGSVNFSTGAVDVNGTSTTLKAIFEENYNDTHPGATEADIAAYISSVFKIKDGNYVFKDYTSHSLKIFFMERGAGASNLHMRLNLSYVPPSNVLLTKKLSGPGKDDLDYNLVQYPFQIKYKNKSTGAWEFLKNETINGKTTEYVTYKISAHHVDYTDEYYHPSQTNRRYDNVYLLNPGQSAEIRFPVEISEYQIIECAVNHEVYDSVKINDVTSSGTLVSSSPFLYDHESTTASTEDRPTITFDNEVGADKTRTLRITKKLYDAAGNPIDYDNDKTTFNYRLWLSNGADDESLSLTNMYQYNVRDEDGNYCRWNYANQCFESTGIDDYQNLSNLDEVTFETSMNGSISKIPAGYTVEARDLPVGMKFKVEERTWEIPLGYKFVDYSYDTNEGNFNLDSKTDTFISGWVKNQDNNGDKASPEVFVNNQRGWEIESEKVWSDKNYVSSHDPIYTAVFVDGVYVQDTLRKITDSSLTARYYFDGLDPGKTFDDYKVYEVKFDDAATFDGDGNVLTYNTVSPVTDTINVKATPISTGTPIAYDYSVSYDWGTSEMTGVNEPTGGNIRRDTILNSRDEGVIISVYDMTSRNAEDKVPLKGVPFILEKYDSVSGDYVEVESLTSDENGKLTILYYDKNTNYRLTQKSSLQGYLGLTDPVIFKIDNDNNISFVGSSEDDWKECDELENQSLTAFVNVYNKPYALEFYKTDSVPNALAGAHFKLYEGKTNAFGDVVKDSSPMPGCDDLVSSNTGIIPNIDNTLKPGRYFLVETEAPTGYKKVVGDIYFEITELGKLILRNVPSGVEDISDSTKIPHEYRIKVVDEMDGFKSVTITKKVTGNMGNKTKDFLFTFNIDNPDPAGYSWSKNNEPQDDNLVVSNDPDLNHNTFFLAHDDTVTILVPDGSDVTITEAPLNYTASYSVYPVPDDPNCPPVNGTGVTVTIDDIDKNMKIDYTNELNTLIPTGVFTDFKTLLILSGCLILAILMILIKLRLNHLRNLKRKD